MIDLDRTLRTHLAPSELAEIIGICRRAVYHRISRNRVRYDVGKYGGWRIPLDECKRLRDMELGITIPEKSTPVPADTVQSRAKSH